MVLRKPTAVNVPVFRPSIAFLTHELQMFEILIRHLASVFCESEMDTDRPHLK